MGQDAVVFPRCSLDEPPTPPPLPLTKALEFADSSIGFAICRATLGVGAFFVLFLFVITVPCLT